MVMCQQVIWTRLSFIEKAQPEPPDPVSTSTDTKIIIYTYKTLTKEEVNKHKLTNMHTVGE